MKREWIENLVIAFALVVFLSLNGCSAPTGTRCVTAWGLWSAPFGTPLGIGYWNSAHGEHARCGESAKPPEVQLAK